MRKSIIAMITVVGISLSNAIMQHNSISQPVNAEDTEAAKQVVTVTYNSLVCQA